MSVGSSNGSLVIPPCTEGASEKVPKGFHAARWRDPGFKGVLAVWP
jgi:hypothetical protein